MHTYLFKLTNKPLYLISKLTIELAKTIDKPNEKRPLAFYRFETDCASAKVFFEKNNSVRLRRTEYLRFVLNLENLEGNLKEIFFAIKLHKIKPDSTIESAIVLLERVLIEIAQGLTGKQISGYAARGKKTITHARKMIHLAKIGASDKDNFIENLKFSNIYGNLDKCFQIIEDLFEMITQIKK